MNADTQRDVRAYLNRELKIGRDVKTRGSVYLSLDVLMETSVHVIGASGYGKSFWLRNVIDQFITHHQPFSLIDPHGDLFAYAVAALRRSAVRPGRIVLLDPSDDRYAVGFNPLRAADDPSEAASLVLDACLKAWGSASFDETPRLEGILRGMFRMLAESGLTLLESYEFLNVDHGEFRTALRERVSDPFVRQDWLEFEKLSRGDRLAVVESSRNRLRRFLQSVRIQRMLGQTHRVLDLRRVMDDGQFMLVNLGGLASSPETQRLLGALLLNAVYHAAKMRNPERRRDHFVIVDECGQFASADLANSMDELRKYGVHFLLAHQRLRQLEREDSEVLSAILTNAKVRVVFGGLERLEAERIARELFTGEVCGDQVKHIAYGTRFRPVADVFEVESESWTDSEGEADGFAWGESSSTSTQQNESAVYSIDDDNRHGQHDEDDVIARTTAQGMSASRSQSSSGSRALQRSHSSGGSRSIVPITRYEEFQEETGRQFVSVTDQWEERTARVHGLAKREALVRIYNGPVIHVRTPDVEVERHAGASDRFVTRALEACRYTQPIAAVEAESEERQRKVAALTASVADPRLRMPIRSFRE